MKQEEGGIITCVQQLVDAQLNEKALEECFQCRGTTCMRVSMSITEAGEYVALDFERKIVMKTKVSCRWLLI